MAKRRLFIKLIGLYFSIMFVTFSILGFLLNYLIKHYFGFFPYIGMEATSSKIRDLFIYSAAASTLFSAIVVHFTAKHLTSPLRAMTNVAKKMAKGDFTERVQVYQEDEIGDLTHTFNYMAEQIERQEKMRRGFVADVSHELKSPLTNIQGFVEALIDGKAKTEEERLRYLGVVHKETRRLIRLVNELLDLSRLDTGYVSGDMTLVNLTKLIRDLEAKISPVLEASERQLIVSIPPSDVFVLGHKDRLEQVVLNLLDNANRYSRPCTDIKIQLTLIEQKVEVAVIDQGDGIPAEDLPYIWERFYKVDKSRQREGNGTGLGLAIVKQIINSFGGDVFADCVPNQGCTIGFWLEIKNEPKEILK